MGSFILINLNFTPLLDYNKSSPVLIIIFSVCLISSNNQAIASNERNYLLIKVLVLLGIFIMHTKR
jgi:hypothetical protein